MLQEPIQQNLRFAIKKITGNTLIYVIFATDRLAIIVNEITEKIILVTQAPSDVL